MKKVLVTGASRGIGLEVCKLLKDKGVYVVGICRNLSYETKISWDESVGDCGELHSVNISDESAVNAFFKNIFSEGKYPDLLVNNAGITSDAMFHKMTSEQWSNVINVNLIALFNVTQPIYQQMIKNKFGRIVNVSSINGEKGQAGQANYSASKAGVHGFTMALAQEGARNNILVNTVSPGYTETEMLSDIKSDIKNKIKDSIPLKRFGHPKEIAKTIVFLLSEDSGYTTGANISVNGGLYLS